MSFRGLFKFAFLAAQVVVGIASPLDSRASEELVQTPAGLFPKSNVHAVPHGAKVHQSPTEVQIIGANGTVIHSVPYSSNSRSAGVLPKPTSASANISRRALQSGYIAYAYWENTASSPISFLGTDWNVPPTPASWDGQLLYWWNGLVPVDFNGILQPVLQYGISPAGGGEFYSIASWWLIGSDVFHTGITQVLPGTLLQGQMNLVGTSTSGGVTTYSYSSTFVGYPSTTISASTTVVLNWVYEALEIYTTAQLSDLPTGSLEFSAIEVTLQNGQHPSSLGWTPISDSTDGITMSILSSSATAGALLISTPSSGSSSLNIHPNGDNSKCVGISGGVYTDGTAVDIYDCNASTTQKWQWNGDALTSINPVDGSQWCLDSGNQSTWVNGLKMKIWQCFSNLPQQTWTPVTTSGTIKLTSANFCLDLPNGDKTNKNVLQIWTCTPGDVYQIWSVTSS